MKKYFQSVLELSRVRTIMDFYPFLMFLGFLVSRVKLDLNVILALGANLLLLVFAFMINDIADSKDDRKDGEKAKRNPVSAGRISRQDALVATYVIGFFGVMLSVLINFSVGFIGLLILVFGFIYSMEPIRLKSRRITDVISHGLFLAALQILFFGAMPGGKLDAVTWIMALGVFIYSMGGDLYNEVRDFQVDQKAGITNTADMIGKKNANRISILFVIIGLLLVVGVGAYLLVPGIPGIISGLFQ